MARKTRWWGLGVVLALAACGAPPPLTVGSPEAQLGQLPDAQGIPAESTYRVLATEELPIVGVTVDSEAAGLGKARLVDGDLATQWSNGGYKNATAWAAVQLAASAALASVTLKTGPMPAGTSFDLQVSGDGTAWTTMKTGQTCTTWGLETKLLPAGTAGRFVRVLWHNSTTSPQPHFAIYELVVNGTAGSPSPAPSTTPSMAPSPVSSPTAAPSTLPSSAPSSGPAAKAAPIAVTASSTYSGLTTGRATDGNLSTQWSNGGYKEASAWLRLEFAQRQAFASVKLKTGALPSGVSYAVEVSDDGTTWRSASGALTNTTWNLETKAASGQGRFLRVRFTNSASAPIARFSLYEIEAYGSTSGLNHAPIISGTDQSPYYIPADGQGSVICHASDPDGDPLTYAWEVVPGGHGTVSGSGSVATYTPENFGPTTSDGDLRVTVRDGRGGEAVAAMTARVYYGSTTDLMANTAMEWDPAKTATANLSGTATVQASGDFAGYSAVVCEYTTAAGRQLALLPPGTTTLSGATGLAYMYLLGPSGTGPYYPDDTSGQPGPDIPQPAITLTLSSGAGTVTRSITQANLVASNHVGYQLTTTPHGPWYYLGENGAMNGTRPYTRMLSVQTLSQYDSAAERFKLSINYGLHQSGDNIPVWYDFQDDDRLLFTDSKGGAADNTGGWTLYISDEF